MPAIETDSRSVDGQRLRYDGSESISTDHTAHFSEISPCARDEAKTAAPAFDDANDAATASDDDGASFRYGMNRFISRSGRRKYIITSPTASPMRM